MKSENYNKVSVESKVNEALIKTPMIAEHNLMGAKYKNKEITKSHWDIFKADWHNSFCIAMLAVVKNRVYVEGAIDG